MKDDERRFFEGGGCANDGLHRVDCSAFQHLCRQMCEVKKKKKNTDLPSAANTFKSIDMLI